MQGCLGIYVQKNLIKYAKVSKDRNSFKVEAYGVKFYDGDIEKTIEQIVKETYSFQVPISINIDSIRTEMFIISFFIYIPSSNISYVFDFISMIELLCCDLFELYLLSHIVI